MNPLLASRPRGSFQILDPESGQAVECVFQATGKAYANAGSPGDENLQLRRKVRKTKGSTPGQMRTRRLLAEAVALWRTLPEPDQNRWTIRGKALQPPLPGYHAFLSNFMRTSA